VSKRAAIEERMATLDVKKGTRGCAKGPAKKSMANVTRETGSGKNESVFNLSASKR